MHSDLFKVETSSHDALFKNRVIKALWFFLDITPRSRDVPSTVDLYMVSCH